MSTIWSALVLCILFSLFSASLFILYFAGRDLLRFNCDSPSNITVCDPTLRVLGGTIPDPLFPVFSAIFGAASLIGIGLLGHLALFHVYLSKRSTWLAQDFTPFLDFHRNERADYIRILNT